MFAPWRPSRTGLREVPGQTDAQRNFRPTELRRPGDQSAAQVTATSLPVDPDTERFLAIRSAKVAEPYKLSAKPRLLPLTYAKLVACRSEFRPCPRAPNLVALVTFNLRWANRWRRCRLSEGIPRKDRECGNKGNKPDHHGLRFRFRCGKTRPVTRCSWKTTLRAKTKSSLSRRAPHCRLISGTPA
jgi:hypothetical protein